MNQQSRLKKHYFEKFLYSGENHHVDIANIAPISTHQQPITQTNVRHDLEIINYRKALSLLINKNPDYLSHNETQPLMEKVCDKYDWIRDRNINGNKEDDNNSPTNVNSIIEKEFNKRLQQSMENKNIKSSNRDFNSSLMDNLVRY